MPAGLAAILLHAALAFAPAAEGKPNAELQAAISAALPGAVAEYKWFHAHPELSNQEAQTAKHLAQSLRNIGLEVHEGIGGHGVVGILRSSKGADKGPVVLYRADMDGLPVSERTGVPYASKNPGVMHACGHDVHMATAVGALEVLKALDNQWQGTVLFVGQPAEETGQGAKAMLEDRRFKALLAKLGKPKVALALHDAADLPAGQVSLITGYHHANVDSVDIRIHGRGGHGAQPENTVDPIVIGAEIVMALQTIVSRKVPAQEPAVITVGKFFAGSKHNIIPPDATLLLTVRSYSDATRKLLLREIERVAKHVASAHDAPRAPEVVVDDAFVPAAFNDAAWTERLRARFVAELGAASVLEHTPSLGGEDFGLFPRDLKIPGVMWKLGAVDPGKWRSSKGKGLPGLHSDKYAAAPEPTLRAGVRTVVAAVLEAMSPTPSVTR